MDNNNFRQEFDEFMAEQRYLVLQEQNEKYRKNVKRYIKIGLNIAYYDVIIKMYNDGIDVSTIAKYVNKNSDDVIDIINKLNLGYLDIRIN